MNTKVCTYFWSGVCIICTPVFSNSQTASEPEDPIPNLELPLIENGDQESRSAVTIKDVSERFNINQIQSADLESLQIIPPFLIELILDYVSTHKPVLSIYELQTIEGMDLDLLHELLKHLYVESDRALSKNVQELSQSKGLVILGWSKTLDPEAAYFTPDSFKSTFAGSPDHMYMRLRTKVNSVIQIGLNLEKDPGEPWSNPNALGYIDHISGYIKLEHLSPIIQSMYLGDYHLKIARGLLLSNGLFQLDGIDPGFALKNKTFLKPYQASGENDMLRGIAMDFRMPHQWNAIVFYSQKKIDARLEKQQAEMDTTEILGWTSLLNSGYHRSFSELIQRKNVSESMYGGHLAYQNRHAQLGCSLLHSMYGKPCLKAPATIPTSNDMTFASGDYILKLYHLNVEGEFGITQYGHIAHSHALVLGLGKKCSYSFTYSYFDPGFYATRSQTSSRSGNSINEEKISLGLQIQFHYKWQMNVNGNYSRMPMPDLRIPARHSAWDYQVSLVHTERKKFKMKLQLNTFQTITLLGDQANLGTFEENRSVQMQAYIEQMINRTIDWKFRVIYRKGLSEGVSGKGFAVALDGRMKSLSGKWSTNGRIELFDISNYQNRIYIPENDVRYHFNLLALSGKGLRMYVNLRYKPIPKLTLETKFSITTLYETPENRPLELPSTEKKRELKIQLLYNL